MSKKIEVIMILENVRSLIELFIFRTVCQMLYLMLILLIYLSVDKFWMFQDVKYNYTVNLAGTGDRSEYDIES